jgi:hypothetical protein
MGASRVMHDRNTLIEEQGRKTEAYVHTATQGFTNNKKKYGVQNFKYAQLCFLFFLSNKRVETYGRFV